MNWYQYSDSYHGYIPSYQGSGTDTPHYANDIQTPFHTPLTAILPGTVTQADYAPWGGEIFIRPDDSKYPVYYFYHPDLVEVKPGQHVAAGQEVALSGGENPGYPGAMHPATPQWSTGPHTHVGWFTGWDNSTPAGTVPKGPDITPFIESLKTGKVTLPPSQGTGTATTTATTGTTGSTTDSSALAPSPLAGTGIDMTAITQNFKAALIAIALFLLALLLVVGGFFLLAKGETAQ